MVKALVGESTRKTAHNLDDLYERWMLRREQTFQETHQLTEDAHVEMFLPDIDLDTVEPGEQLNSLRNELVQKKILLAQHLTELNKSKPSYKKRQELYYWSVEAAPIKHAITRVDGQIIALNHHKITDGKRDLATEEYIRKLQDDKHGIMVRLAEAQGLLVEAQTEIIRLQQVIIDIQNT